MIFKYFLSVYFEYPLYLAATRYGIEASSFHFLLFTFNPFCALTPRLSIQKKVAGLLSIQKNFSEKPPIDFFWLIVIIKKYNCTLHIFGVL